MEHKTSVEWLRCLVMSVGPDADKISEVIAKYLKQYIWEQDELVFHNHTELPCPWQSTLPDDSATEWMWSEIHHCGSLDDEWFLAFVLSYITDVYKGQVMAQVFTNEGQFMLTEAASLLPSWVDCARHGSIDEIANSRVWIYNGLLHLIPLRGNVREDFTPKALTLSRAVHAVRCSGTNTLAPARIQEYLFKQHLSRFPSAIMTLTHRAKVWLPRAAAATLLRHKEVCASATRAFLDRTASEMRTSLKNGQFWPDCECMSDAPMVTCVIPMRKSHYATLVSSQFSAPKVWPRPLDDSSAARKQADLGLKLTIGLQILLHRSCTLSMSGIVHGSVSEQAKLDEMPEWHRYISALQSQGFFGDEVQGSALHQRRCKDAEAAFRGSRVFADMQQHAAATASDIQTALASPVTNAELADNARVVEDSDTWLVEEFNSRMEAYTHAQCTDSAPHARSQPEDAQAHSSAALSAVDVMDRLSRFFESGSSAAGACPNPSSFSLDAEKLLQALRGDEQSRSHWSGSDEDSNVSASGTDDDEMHAHTDSLHDTPTSRSHSQSFMKAYMDQMESEIGKKSGRDSQVDVSMETVSNLLRSVTEGSDIQPGAAHGLFGMLGVSVPKQMNVECTESS